MGCRAALGLLALALVPALCAGGPPIRGLDPALGPRYEPTADGKFACLDGKKSVPFEQVNDNYCDCFDGSDEPGTSACPNGHFFCANKFYLPLLLNASMVDDGVCDCCDGSDEPAGRCPNNCYEKGYKSLIALKDQMAAADKGVQARNKYVEEAGASKQKWADRKAQVDAEVEKHRKEKEAADADKSKLEEEQRKLQDRKRELEEEKKKRQPPEEPAKSEGEQQQETAAFEDEQQVGGAEGVGEEQAEPGVEEAAEDEAVEKSEEELAKERMAQWIPGAKDGDGGAVEEEAGPEEDADPVLPSYDGEDLHAADAAALEEEDAEPQQFFPDEGAADVDVGASGADGDGGDAGEPGAEEGAAGAGASAAGAGASAAGGNAGQRPTSAFGKARLLLKKVFKALAKPGNETVADDTELTGAIAAIDAEISALKTRLDPARTKANEARQKLNDLEQEQRKLQAKLDGSYGEGDAFVALVDRCFDAKVDKYTYEVCPFDKASQKEGGSATSLGSWSGFEAGETKLAFKNGATCWQGPSRSMTVSLHCGQTERLAKVEEPSRCEYSAELQTPAACTPAAAEALRREVEARQRFLEGGDEVEGDPQANRDEL